MRSGVTIGAITGRDTPLVTRRMAGLGIDLLVQGCDDKAAAARKMLAELGLEPRAMSYAGDDVIDLEVMAMAGLAISVPNGHTSARAAAHWITPRPGGQGAVRDICDLIVQARQ